MEPPISSRLALGLAILGALAAAACTGTGGNQSGSTVYDDAGNCVKDREALSEILVQPQACVSSTECPAGSFCNGETGQCDWECYTDSDCGFGAACSCDGICNDGSPPGPGATGDPACPRDLDLLQDTSPDIHNRECTRDEHCPYGARCDDETHRCDYDCLADTDCTGGNVCDCRGECVEPGCAEPVPERRVPTVEVTPDVITVLPGNTWGKQTFTIRITDPDATIGTGLLPRARVEAPTPTGLGNLGLPLSEAVAETINTYAGVHFSTTEESRALAHANTATATTLTTGGVPSAIANRMVAARPFANLAAVLNVDGAGASTLQALKTATQITSANSCTLQVREVINNRWSISTANGYSATAATSINRCSAVDNYPRDLYVSVYFVDAADTTKVVQHLAYRTIKIDDSGAASTTPTTSTGEFSGYLVQENAAGDPLTIPVRAFGDASGLKIFDDLRLLSASGWFQLATTATYLNHIDQATGNGGVSPGQTPGKLTGQISGWTDELLTGGRRDGHFTLTLATSTGQPLKFRYRLVRKSSTTAPSVPANPTSSINTLANLADAWRAKAGFLNTATTLPDTTRANLVERLLCYGYDGSLGTTAPLVGPVEQESFRYDPELIFSTASDDSECSKSADESHAQTAFGLVTGWDHWSLAAADPVPDDPITNPPVEAAVWLSECLDDLARDIPNLGSATSVTEKTNAWFGAPGACISLGQVVPALASIVHDQVDGAGSRYVDQRDATLFQRILAGWLDVHAFVLLQGIQANQAAAPLITGDSTPVETLLARAERGWDVLLDPNYVTALKQLPRKMLAIPDYRRPRPTAYWTFDAADRSGNHILDVAGSSNMDLSGGYTDDAPGVRLNSGTTATLPVGSLSTTGDVSVSFWMRPSSLLLDTDFNIISAGNAFSVKARRSSSGWWITAGHGGFTFNSNTQTSTSSWTLITVTRRGNTYSIWSGANNKIGAPVPPSTTQPTASTGGTIFGPLLVGGNLSIDDVAVWEHALTQQHIEEIFARGQSTAANPRPLLQPIGSVWTATSQFFHAPSPNADQAIGLPAKIVETAIRHAGVVDAFASQELERVYGGCYASGSSPEQQLSIARASASLRYVNAAEALARDLRVRAGEVACTANLECTAAGGSTCGGQGVCLAGAAPLDIVPAWNARYQNALVELAALRSRAVSSIQRLAACENPFGIPEDDLPIYFGDVEGTNSRYFASSDYLAASWARPAVQSAVYSLEAAREGWLAKRDSDIRQLMNQYEAERRLEGIELGYAQSVMDACGITDQDGLEVLDGTIDPSTCFRSTDCAPDNNSPACLRGSLGQALLGVQAAGAQVVLERFASDRRFLEWQQEVDRCRLEAPYLFQSPPPVGTGLESINDYEDAVADAHQAGAAFMSDVLGDVAQLLDQGEGGPVDVDWAAKILEGCLESGFGGAGAAVCGGPVHGPGLGSTSVDLTVAFAAVNADMVKGYIPAPFHPCWLQVRERQQAWLSGMDDILARQIDLSQAWNQFEVQHAATARQVAQAKSALAREQGRTLPSVAHHYWMDEKIARFERDFARAKRFTYLAMRAVEYEFQQSLGLRTQILTAQHPDDLVEALDILDAERATRTINSRRPAAGTEVLSLRTDILALGNLQPPAAGERASTSVVRLQDILTSPEYAYYDDNGDYLGQAIPFTVAESGALRHRCGERLWRVTATIQGDLTDVDEPRAQVYLLKRNVFKSQWCEGLGDETPYQQGSTAGGSNLFTADATTVGREGSEFTPALIYPWYNVRRSDFYRDDYTQGSSEELAGRGLYGEYVLLFPQYGMLEPPADCVEGNVCTDGTSPGCSDPFRDLRRIEDVLIRFDYLSVDDL